MKLTNETIYVGKNPSSQISSILLYNAKRTHSYGVEVKERPKVLNTYIAALHTSNRHVIIQYKDAKAEC